MILDPILLSVNENSSFPTKAAPDRKRLNDSRDFVAELAAEGQCRRGPMPPICMRAAEHRLTPRDLVQLELLRKGLNSVSSPRVWQQTG